MDNQIFTRVKCLKDAKTYFKIGLSFLGQTMYSSDNDLLLDTFQVPGAMMIPCEPEHLNIFAFVAVIF